MKTALILGGGSQLGLELTNGLIDRGYHVFLITSAETAKSDRLTPTLVDWKNLSKEDVENLVPNVPQIDVVFFNQNHAVLSDDSFKSLEQNFGHWQQGYFINCQLPFYLISALGDKLSESTKIGWMLSKMIAGPRNQHVGHADYIGYKFTNACIMRSFGNNHRSCFFGLCPESIHNLSQKTSDALIDIIDKKAVDELNGNIFTVSGERLEFFKG